MFDQRLLLRTFLINILPHSIFHKCVAKTQRFKLCRTTFRKKMFLGSTRIDVNNSSIDFYLSSHIILTSSGQFSLLPTSAHILSPPFTPVNIVVKSGQFVICEQFRMISFLFPLMCIDTTKVLYHQMKLQPFLRIKFTIYCNFYRVMF